MLGSLLRVRERDRQTNCRLTKRVFDPEGTPDFPLLLPNRKKVKILPWNFQEILDQPELSGRSNYKRTKGRRKKGA